MGRGVASHPANYIFDEQTGDIIKHLLINNVELKTSILKLDIQETRESKNNVLKFKGTVDVICDPPFKEVVIENCNSERVCSLHL